MFGGGRKGVSRPLVHQNGGRPLFTPPSTPCRGRLAKKRRKGCRRPSPRTKRPSRPTGPQSSPAGSSDANNAPIPATTAVGCSLCFLLDFVDRLQRGECFGDMGLKIAAYYVQHLKDKW